jgi:hypothetical protein
MDKGQESYLSNPTPNPTCVVEILRDLGHVHRLVFWKHKNIKTYISRPKIPEKYFTPSTGTKCKNIVSHVPFAPK